VKLTHEVAMVPPLGIQLYTVRDLAKDGRHTEVLRRLGEIGYTAVETGATYGMTVRDFRKLVEDCGMKVASRSGPPPTRDNYRSIVDALGELGADLAMGGFWEKEYESVDAVRRTADVVREGTELLAREGITFCLHNHWMEYQRLEGRLAAEWLADFCPSVRFEIDVYWATYFGVEDPAAIVRMFRGRAPLLHLKDGPFTRDQPMTAAGAGKQDFAAIMAAADPAVLRYGLLEIDRVAGDMMQAVEDSYRYLVGRGLCKGNRPVA
jgi:sugar phosphate isomerase/epimerase